MGMVDTKNKLILGNGRFSGTTRSQLDEAFVSFIASPQNGALVVHFHGGLVSLADGEAIAARLLPFYQGAGAYPLFVLWQAGLLETLRHNWQDIVKRDVFALLRDRVLQFVVGKLDQDLGQKGGNVEVPPVFEVQEE